MPERRRVLVAGTLEAVDSAQTALGDEFDLLTAYSVSEALERVGSGVELVLCNVRFDDSRMFDFLGALSANPPAQALPVVCYRVMRSRMSAGARRGIELALEALGVSVFLDLYEVEQQHGAATARDALRSAVKRYLAKERS
jgi:hypothetical protein